MSTFTPHTTLTPPAVQIELTPPLALAAALLYMMLSNGEVEKAEIDQLQSVIGKNADLLRCAVDYVQTVPVDRFIKEVPEVLGESDRLCVLTNMCDAMLSDGQTDAAELDLLARLAASFGLQDEEFQPFYEAIALKNDKTVLGPFDRAKLAAQQATPHLAMAASLIYMMASDGSLGPEEIGRLQAMIGEFEGLQKVAVKYALKVKSEQFFASAARFLNDDQKIFILTNVCDIMLADGVIEAAEQVVFQNMRNAFGYTEEEFAPFHTAISAKNLKTFDTDSFTYARDSRWADDSDPDDVFSGGGISLGGSPRGGGTAGASAQFGSTMSRAMRANVVKVSSDFGSAKKLNRISINSTFHASAERDTATTPPQAAPDNGLHDAFAGTAPTPENGRRSRAPWAHNRTSDAPLSVGEDTSSAMHRKTTRRPRRARVAKHDHHIKMKAVIDLDHVRQRLKKSHLVNAEIRKQLDRYDATGPLPHLPVAGSPVAEPMPPVAAAPSAVLAAPIAIAGLPVWRIAVPVALLASALMTGTALMASMAAPQLDTARTDAPLKTAS